ncbi:unnamed protein product [Microthlaspi erraticum]|uniref:Uncharacterized protein n=1 Tax=Microthlaspi erraticum TaxID=1685480 RepID=A0A6D2L488_9BRAS|nr:unnamed protein product [Microthlaspi erraticum]
MLRMFGTGLKVSRSFYSSVSELTYPSEESLVKATCRDPPMIALLKAHLPTDPFPQHKRADLLLLVSSLNGLPSINGSVGSSSISSTMKSVGISTFPILKGSLFATDKGMRLTDDPRSQRLFLKDRGPNMQGKVKLPRIFLFVGDDLPLNDCTALTSQHYHPLCFPGSLLNSILQKFLISSIELWFVLLSLVSSARSSSGSGFCSSSIEFRVELSAYSTKSSPSSSSMSTAIWGGLPLLGNCRPLLSVTAWHTLVVKRMMHLKTQLFVDAESGFTKLLDLCKCTDRGSMGIEHKDWLLSTL